MKKNLDWTTQEVANIFDEVTLWSAPFGRMLLENMPMKSHSKIVDIGFGTGFPLIELSQRFGEKSMIYGIDIWEAGINRTLEKIGTLDIKNIEIIKESASQIKLGDNHIDLITSNLGVNNFEEKEAVYAEIYRILKPKGRLCLTTNPVGTFEELFDLFASILRKMGLEKETKKLGNYVKHRSTEQAIITELEQAGFNMLKTISDTTNIRFVDAEALLNHSIVRIGFRESWEKMIREESKDAFFQKVIQEIDKIIDQKGEFAMKIPMLYLEFEKEENAAI